MIQSSCRQDHVWPVVWMDIGEAAQNREKQEWAKAKPKLDSARRSWRPRLHRNSEQCETKNRKTNGTRYAL